MKLSIVIPTYNEKENLKVLIPTIERILECDFEILVVDDSSPDQTGLEALKLNTIYHNIRLITRPKKEGIGAALREGYDKADGDYIISTDADLSFPPEGLLAILKMLQYEGYDLVLGCRHHGANYERKNFSTKIKWFVSKFGNIMVRWMTGVPVNDFSANFRGIKKTTWQDIETTDNTNTMLLEMIIKAHNKNYRIGQFTTPFIDRQYGNSKLNLMREAPKFFLKLVKYTWLYRIRNNDGNKNNNT